MLNRPRGIANGVKINLFSVVACLVLPLLLATPLRAQISVSTYHNDNFRSGANLAETLLSANNVNSTTFGRVFSFAVDDFIVGQPLYVPQVATSCGTRNLIIVATLSNSVYAFDATGGTPCGVSTSFIWHYHNAQEPPTSFASLCKDSGYEKSNGGGAGIVSTPVIDTVNGLVYFVTKTTESSVTVINKLVLHVIDLATGGARTNQEIDIDPQIPNVSYLPFYQMSRPGMLLDSVNNSVYAGLGSTGCKQAPGAPAINNHGFALSYTPPGTSIGFTKRGAFATTPTTNNGGIWQTGGGIAEDKAGFIYVSTAEQPNPEGNNLGNSVLKLSNDASTLLDFFTPFDVATLNTNDNDLGSVGPVLIDDNTTNPVGHYLIASGKPSEIYLLNRDSLGKFCGTTCSTNTNIVEDILAPSDIRGSCMGGGAGQICRMASPAYWNTTPRTDTANGLVYFSEFGGHNLLAYSLGHGPTTVNGDCTVNKGPVSLSCGPVAQTNLSKPGNFLTPSVSADCLTPIGSTGTECVGNSAILWVVTRVSNNGVITATLRAFNAKPSGTTLTEIFNSDTVSGDALAPGSDVDHFASVTIAAGRVYVGTHKEVVAYGCRNNHPNCQ